MKDHETTCDKEMLLRVHVVDGSLMLLHIIILPESRTAETYAGLELLMDR